jgi:hypothetical protein
MQALGLLWNELDPLSADLLEVRRPVPEPRHPGTSLLLEHWQKGEEEGGFRVGRHVPSRALAGILRNLALYEPDDAGEFHVRLAGTAFRRRFGRDITSLALSQIYRPSDYPPVRERVSRVLAERRPSVYEVSLARGDRVFLRFETVRMPVLSRDGASTWVMGGLFFSDWP